MGKTICRYLELQTDFSPLQDGKIKTRIMEHMYEDGLQKVAEFLQWEVLSN